MRCVGAFQVDSYRKKLKELDFTEEKEVNLNQKISTAHAELSRLKQQEQAHHDLANFDFIYHDPEPNFDRRRVYGACTHARWCPRPRLA